jgi:hypothetical protein
MSKIPVGSLLNHVVVPGFAHGAGNGFRDFFVTDEFLFLGIPLDLLA